MTVSLIDALALKHLPRAGWARAGVQGAESVAGHSWSVALLALRLTPSTLDRQRCIAMALVHDLPELQVGDITPHDGVSATEKRARETAAAREMFSPDSELLTLWAEYDAGHTPESRLVHALDKLDMALQAIAYARDRGVDTGDFIRSARAQLQAYPTLLAEIPSGDRRPPARRSQ